MFDYQSDRHCAKTVARHVRTLALFDYQSDRHCAKTGTVAELCPYLFDYQSDRHCAKTTAGLWRYSYAFDYQSDRHCAKTIGSKSPLQRTFESDWKRSLALNKVQVNTPFILILVDALIKLVLQEQNSCFLEKHLLREEFKVIF